LKKPIATIITEAGVNHSGSINTSKKMIDTAAETGADLVNNSLYFCICRQVQWLKIVMKKVHILEAQPD
jgi:hypothetical protein